ncbi:beta-lactamase superfamily domain-containing protein [Tirmania nivea]|nr:beta-lactamase superfamily domain-containing protein [Tirmania nivea]
MSLASALAITYTTTVDAPPNALASPEDAGSKLHHLKSGGKNQKGMFLVVPPSFLGRETQVTSLRATWLGHACYYAEFPGGFRALFDPVFSNRCSPIQFMGPARFTKIPCKISDILAIDAVIISHNHYDHLDYGTVMDIKKYHPSAWFFVFYACGVENVTEPDWWEEREIKLRPKDHEGDPCEIVARIGCLPCQHGSARGVHDQFGTLWASWSVMSGGKKVWFADTGYRAVPYHLPEGEFDYGEAHKDLPVCPPFKQIGELRARLGAGVMASVCDRPFRLFSSLHANPYDSVNIFSDTRCQKALGMHWGTWMLTLEDVLEPPKLLREALAWKGLDTEGVFDVVNIGESRVY